MRKLAVAGGLAAYALFAWIVWRLYAPDPAQILAFESCAAGTAAEATSPAQVVPFYRTLAEPLSLRLCARYVGAPEVLVLPRVAANMLEVRVDGETLYRFGNVGRPANLWIRPHVVPLAAVAPGEHRVEIRLDGLYDIGLRLAPYFSTWNAGGLRAAILVWMTDDLVALATGLNLGVGLLLLAYSVLRRRERPEFALYGLASIAAAIFMADFVPTEGFASAELFFWRRKLSVACAYLTIAALAAGLERAARVERRVGPYFLGGAGLLALAALTRADLADLKAFSSWAAILVAPVTLYGVAVAVRRLEPHFSALWVFFGASMIHAIVNVALPGGHLYLVQYGLLAGSIATGVRAAVQLTRVARELDRASRAALTDPLTGARNRAFCEHLELGIGDVVALLDFDDFKRVNDLHGHARGDRLLVDFVHAARGRLRASDHVVRLGGDEFALVMHGISAELASVLCSEVVTSWRHDSADIAPTASVGIATVPAVPYSFWEALAVADSRMYARKPTPTPARVGDRAVASESEPR